MKGVSIDLQVECDCGHLVTKLDTMPGLPMLKEIKLRCPRCGAGFFLHLQEVKKALATKFPDAV